MRNLAERIPVEEYRRDAATVRLFAGLLAFGFLNAVLGPALPYLRSVEQISYVVGSLHQVGFAVGGGLAGLLAARTGPRLRRTAVIRVGLSAAGVAGIGVGYGDRVAITVTAAMFMSLLGSSAMVRIWGALADAHGARRTIALAEGETLVSVGSITAPLLIAGLAGTVLSWRFAFVIGAGACVAAAMICGGGPHPLPPQSSQAPGNRPSPDPAAKNTLVIVFAIVALEFSLSFWLASYLNGTIGLPRQLAVLMVSGLYAANLAGRVLAGRLAHRMTTARLLGAALALVLVGLPILLTADDAVASAVAIAVVGTGIGATFPLSSSLHIAASPRTADSAVGQVLAVASPGQILGPLVVGVIAQVAGLRAGLLTLPACALLALGALIHHGAH